MPATHGPEPTVERWSGYVVRAGLVIIVAGLLLSFLLVVLEFQFQLRLLAKFGVDYKWRPIGTSYVGVAVIGIGALTTSFAAAIALRARAPQQRDANAAVRLPDF